MERKVEKGKQTMEKQHSATIPMEAEEEANIKKKVVCVTGGAGYIGSWLVKKLLLRGYTVHATLRNLSDSLKVGLLQGLPYAEERLKLFEADIYDPGAFAPAIQGCEYVFHVATPLLHQSSEQFKDTTEAAIAGARSILASCKKSGTVKQLIYTASVMSASPLTEDGSGFKDFIDESCWTPLNHSFKYRNEFTSDYITSKTLVEKELLSYNDKEEEFGVDVITLACSLVVGDTLLPSITGSQAVIISQLTHSDIAYKYIRLLHELLGSIPLTHIDDICEAHLFCIEKPLTKGRYLCAQTYSTAAQITNYYKETYPEFRIMEGVEEEQATSARGGSTKLIDMGFEYQYDMKMMIDDSVHSARRLGVLQ